jgi:hypothetical protein
VGNLLEEGALLADEDTALDRGDHHPQGDALSFFSRGP